VKQSLQNASSDQDLASRLNSCSERIEAARNRLTSQREKELRDARSRSPFPCPAELRERIDYLNLLCHHARSRNWGDFLAVYPRGPAVLLVEPELKKWVQVLTDIAAQGGVEQAARNYADCLAFSGTTHWRVRYREFREDREEEWRTVSNLLQAFLDGALSERRVQEDWHEASLALGFEGNLTTHIAELADAVVQGKAIITEVQTRCKREAAATEVVRTVWRETEAVNRYAYRDAPRLSEVDRSLAGDWAHDCGGDSFSIGAMESARGAERVALGIYRDIYGKVEDLSILQKVSPSDTRWLTADLVAGGRWVDVKNARRSFSSPTSYSEHRVKRLKSGPSNRQVIVSGFLSPYHSDSGIRTGEQVVWLGETSLGIIENLRSQFETEYLRLDFSSDWGTRIPPWLFEYPSECYANRDTAPLSGRSQGFILPRSDCPLGFLVLTGRVQQTLPGGPLLEEVLALARRIVASPTRPVLFLHILDRFCRTIRDGMPFPAGALRQILFSGKSVALGEWSDSATPLAIFDPLETVKELLEVLEKVSARCAQRIVTFTSFKLSGVGVLQGRREGEKWQTIFAYCGGWRRGPADQPVKCGQSPLFMGKNDSCNACGKLVCHSCGYCSKDCRHCSSRQAGSHWR
jgi:hypothetical protein